MLSIPPFSWIDKAVDKTAGATLRFFRDFIEWRRRGARQDVLELDRIQVETAKDALQRARTAGDPAQVQQAEMLLHRAEQNLVQDIEVQRDRLRAAAGYYLEDRVPAGALAGEPTLPPPIQEHLRRIIALIEQGLLPPPESADDHFLRGNAYSQASQYDEALAAYDRALKLRPGHPATLTNRGTALGHLGRYEEALAAFDRSLQLRPDHALTLMNRGAALSRLNRHEEALAAFGRALQLLPDDAETLMNRGITLAHLDRREEALQAYTRALQLRPDHPNTLMNRGVTLAHFGRHDEAIAGYDRSLQLRPDHPNTLFNRACAFSLSNKPDKALEDLRRAIANDETYRQQARTDADFDNIRDDPRFQELVGEEEPPSEGGSNS